MHRLRDNLHGMVDIGVVLMVGVAFAALMVLAIVIWKLNDQLNPGTATPVARTIRNVTDGFDDAINLILVAVTVFILAIAIAALLMLRGRKG